MRLKLYYAFMRFGCLPTGILLLGLGGWAAWPVGLVKMILIAAGGLIIILGLAVLGNVYLSHNQAWIHPKLALQSWPITHDRMHNSNVDLIRWRGVTYLVHAVSPYHFGSKDCQLVVKRSLDLHTWVPVRRFFGKDEDIRDPKFAIIQDKLFLYVLVNKEIEPRPYKTMVSWTEDGEKWADLRAIGQEGWLFWRPKTNNGQTWYVPAYWHQFGQTALFSTSDGLIFQQVTTISKDQAVNETDIVFLPQGEMLAVARMEPDKATLHQLFGSSQNCTLISTAPPPYQSFSRHRRDNATRLDGPLLINIQNAIYAVGRSEPRQSEPRFRQGSAFNQKRTALYCIQEEKLHYISDLPSAGDTSYAGAVVTGDSLFIAYYTGSITKDQLWFFSMLEPTEIRIAQIKLDRLINVIPD